MHQVNKIVFVSCADTHLTQPDLPSAANQCYITNLVLILIGEYLAGCLLKQ